MHAHAHAPFSAHTHWRSIDCGLLVRAVKTIITCATTMLPERHTKWSSTCLPPENYELSSRTQGAWLSFPPSQFFDHQCVPTAGVCICIPSHHSHTRYVSDRHPSAGWRWKAQLPSFHRLPRQRVPQPNRISLSPPFWLREYKSASISGSVPGGHSGPRTHG